MKDDAVSPTIATILLIIIAIILAVIVGSFVLGDSGKVVEHKNTGMLVESDHRDVIVTMFTGVDVSSLEELRVSAADGSNVSSNNSSIRTIGVPIRFTGVSGPVSGSSLTTVTGVFSDGTSEVLWIGDLIFKSRPFGMESHTVDNQNYLNVTLPPDWTPADVYNSGAGYGRQIIVRMYNSTGNCVLTDVGGKNYADLSVILSKMYYSVNIASLSPGKYTVRLYSQKVDITDLGRNPFPPIGDEVFHQSEDIYLNKT